MNYVIGIDKGTTATKAVVFDVATGKAIGTARRKTPSFHPNPDWHEEDMEQTFDCVALAIKEVIQVSGVDADEIKAIGVSGHMGGLWALDGEGNPIDRAIAWPDGRATNLLNDWIADGRSKQMYQICGNAPIPGLPLVLLSYLKLHEPKRYERIATVFCAKDYINYRLTGVIATDESDLSFFPCDIRQRIPSPELFALANIEEAAGFIAPIRKIGELVGHVTSTAAHQTGLVEGTPVVSGAGDAVAAAIGAGALEHGDAITVIGTSFMNNLTIDEPLFEPENVGFLFLMPDGRWQRLMANTGGGAVCLDWILSTFGQTEFGINASTLPETFERIEKECRNIPPVPNGLLIHPYFNAAGMTAPRLEPTARGSIFGLDTATSPLKLVRAVMEGVAFSMVDCYGALDAPVRSIRITGGGARSRLWREICASAMGRSLLVPEADETGALGVGILGAVTAGFYPDLKTAAKSMVRISEIVEPVPELHERYTAAYPLYNAIGRDLTILWKQRAALLERSRQELEKP